MTTEAIQELDSRRAGAMRFKDKVCIVTGAGQGIGRAAARRLGAEGGKIIVAERSRESAQETVRQLTQAGVEAMASFADVSSFEQAERLVATAVEKYGRLDVMVNVVGGTIWWQPYHLYTHEQIMLELERSLMTTLWCCHAALPKMVAQGSGSIVNISSSITSGGLNRTPYAVSKGGVNALTVTLAQEYGHFGIRVNAVSPGRTTIPDRTTSRLTLKPGVEAEPVKDHDRFYQETRDDRPNALRRTGSPEEQAAAIAFLASEDASYITGHILDCSGGR
jgi:NAD(P)-dependent dehydrogenase (short-subunit alcohol dehydrogenase family)